MKNDLRKQEQVIIRVLETGTPEEVQRLKQAERDPKLDPDIKDLIRICRCMTACTPTESNRHYGISAKKPSLGKIERDRQDS